MVTTFHMKTSTGAQVVVIWVINTGHAIQVRDTYMMAVAGLGVNLRKRGIPIAIPTQTTVNSLAVMKKETFFSNPPSAESQYVP